MKVSGNIDGISKVVLEKMESWPELTVESDNLIGQQLAEEMASVSRRINREVAVYIDRRGQIAAIAVGNSGDISLPELQHARRQYAPLSGLHCVHTHPQGSGILSDADLSALAASGLDCIAALGVGSDAAITTVGIAFVPEQPMIMDWAAAAEYNWRSQLPLRKQVLDEEQTASAEKAILVALDCGAGSEETQRSLAELAQLAATAGIKVVDSLYQKKNRPEAATYIGKGKAKEIAMLAQVKQADVIIFDDELPVSVMATLAQIIDRKIIDRTMLILDIFASRAISYEGKLQVELAQLRYLLPRLSGQGTQLSRLGGGIGTRGPGESMLEMDRRKIRGRIDDLQSALDNICRGRSVQRQRRTKEQLFKVTLVGYTNAGKSSLLNALSAADTIAEDKLFATLDPLTRRVELMQGQEILLSDTVGFIRRLPHHLIAAFSATLEEVADADLLLHVMDGSADDIEDQASAVMKVVAKLSAADKPMINVINKTDLLGNSDAMQRLLGIFNPAVAISATSGQGLQQLKEMIAAQIAERLVAVEYLLPPDGNAVVAACYEEGRVRQVEYTEQGIKISAEIPRRLWGQLCQQGIKSKLEGEQHEIL